MYTIAKPVLSYACKCWGDSLPKKDTFSKYIEKFYFPVCKYGQNVNKTTYSTRALLILLILYFIETQLL